MLMNEKKHFMYIKRLEKSQTYCFGFFLFYYKLTAKRRIIILKENKESNEEKNNLSK